MGVAILSGIITHLEDQARGIQFLPPTKMLDNTTPSTPTEELPQGLPSKFIACVSRPQSAKRINDALGKYRSFAPSVYVNDNVRAVQEADVILLACKPQMFREILGEEGIREALSEKLLISILAGVTADQLESFLYSSSPPPQGTKACRVVRAMPNTAAFVRESMTVISTSSPPLPAEWNSLVTWVFTRCGRVVHLPPTAMDASTALAGSGPAFGNCVTAFGSAILANLFFSSLSARSFKRRRIGNGIAPTRSSAHGRTSSARDSIFRLKNRRLYLMC
jgi:pyrroline-5-carboxylate reductase